MRASEATTVLPLRVPADLERRIARQARRTRRTKSALLRDTLLQAFADGPPPDDSAREARRQSLLVSRRASERDAPLFRLTRLPGPRTGLRTVSRAMIDKIVSVPRHAITAEVGECSAREVEAVDDGLRRWLGIP